MANFLAPKTSSTGLNAMAGIGDGQGLKCITATLNLTAALASGDVIFSPFIQAGSVITNVIVVLSPNAAGTVNVGQESGLANYFVNGGAGGASGARIVANAPTSRPLVLTRNDRVAVTVGTAGSTATGTVDIIIEFLPRNA